MHPSESQRVLRLDGSRGLGALGGLDFVMVIRGCSVQAVPANGPVPEDPKHGLRTVISYEFADGIHG